MSSAPQAAPAKRQGGGQPFLSDIKELRRRAREHISQGAVTPGYHADRETVVKLLNEALATEIVCVLRYKRHHFMAKGIHAEGVAAEFLEHAQDEQQHADQIAGRITQLDDALGEEVGMRHFLGRMFEELGRDRRGVDAGGHEVVALVAQHADQFRGERLVQHLEHLLAVSGIAGSHGALFDVLPCACAQGLDVGKGRALRGYVLEHG